MYHPPFPFPPWKSKQIRDSITMQCNSPWTEVKLHTSTQQQLSLNGFKQFPALSETCLRWVIMTTPDQFLPNHGIKNCPVIGKHVVKVVLWSNAFYPLIFLRVSHRVPWKNENAVYHLQISPLVPKIFKFEKWVKHAIEMTDDVVHSTQYYIKHINRAILANLQCRALKLQFYYQVVISITASFLCLTYFLLPQLTTPGSPRMLFTKFTAILLSGQVFANI